MVYIIEMQYSSDVFPGFVFISAWSNGALLEADHGTSVDMQMFLVLWYLYYGTYT
jgi:hypothetical protein